VAFSLFTVPLTKTFLPGGWVDGRQYNTFNTDGKNETAALLWNRTINSTIINEARMNVTRWYFDEIKSNPQAPFGVPNVNITAGSFGGNGLKTVQAGFCCGPGVFYQTTYVFRDTLSKVHASHVLKFGGEVAKEQNNSATTWAARPTFDFNNLWSFANDAPNDEGTVTYNPKTGVPSDFRKYFRSSTFGFFAQDNWKVKPNLTLTLGLRYDYFTPLGEKFGRLSNIMLGQGASALTGAKIKTGGDYTNPDRNNFGPQIGFAWSPRSLIGHEFNNKFVLRGGVGVAYNRVPGSRLWRRQVIHLISSQRASPPVVSLVTPTALQGATSCTPSARAVIIRSPGSLRILRRSSRLIRLRACHNQLVPFMPRRTSMVQSGI